MVFFGITKTKPRPEDAVLEIKETIALLTKKENHLKDKINQELQIIQDHLTKHKPTALNALKRKKQYEANMAKISGALTTLQIQVMAIEDMDIHMRAMNAMKIGSEVIKSLHGAVDMGKIDDIMEDVREQMEMANEISSAISLPVGLGVELDEEELEAELADMEQHGIATTIPESENVVDEDLELEELRSSMLL